MATIGEDDGSIRQVSHLEVQLWDRFDKTPLEDQKQLAERINRQLIELADRFRMAAEKRS